jgi:hypothetical protein
VAAGGGRDRAVLAIGIERRAGQGAAGDSELHAELDWGGEGVEGVGKAAPRRATPRPTARYLGLVPRERCRPSSSPRPPPRPPPRRLHAAATAAVDDATGNRHCRANSARPPAQR